MALFNHHKCLTDIGIHLHDGLVPKTKHKKINFYPIKHYFNWKRIKEAEDLMDIVFGVSWLDFKDNVEYNYQKKVLPLNKAYDYVGEHVNTFNLRKTLIYFYDSIKSEITSRWKAFKNYWQYGFWDYDETYSLDWVSTVYLYERVKRYKDLASNWIKLYPENEEDKEDMHKFKRIPIVHLKDTNELKEEYKKNNNMFFSDDDSKYVTIEYKNLYQYECIDLILDYLEKVIKTDQGEHIFKELDTSDKIFNELMDTVGMDEGTPVKDENGNIKYYVGSPFRSINQEQNKRDPYHFFYQCLEEQYVNILQSYAFQIYGKIITSMWW